MSEESQRSTTISVANPGPLGLAAFAMTTFALSVHDAQIGSSGAVAGAASAALVLALAYGGAIQVVAGILEFFRKNSFGALAFCSFGAFWLSYFAFVHIIAPGIKPASAVSGAQGVFLLGWAIFTAYMMIASLRVSTAVATVFVLLTATFILLTVGAFSGVASYTQIGGYVGILTAVAAWYTSFADIVNETYGHVVLPTHSLARQTGGTPTLTPHAHHA